MGLAISIAPEPVLSLGSIVITNSFLTTLVITCLFFIFAYIFNSKKLVKLPKGRSLQNVMEVIAEIAENFYATIIGKKEARYCFAFLSTLFIFIMISSWFGLLPGVGSIGINTILHGEKEFIPIFRAPTADLNTTIALAIMGVVFIQFQGFRSLRLSYLKKFFNFSNPIHTFVGFLELISEGTKVISFAFRLFGNIFAGEVLLAVMSFLVPFLASIPFLGLEIFVGLVQSLVFVMLVLVFTAGATAQQHH